MRFASIGMVLALALAGCGGDSEDAGLDGTSGGGSSDATETIGESGGDGDSAGDGDSGGDGDSAGDGDGTCTWTGSAVEASFEIVGFSGTVFDDTSCTLSDLSYGSAGATVILDCPDADPLLPNPVEISMSVSPVPDLQVDVGVDVRLRVLVDGTGLDGRALRLDRVGVPDPGAWIISVVDSQNLEGLMGQWPVSLASVSAGCEPMGTECGDVDVQTVRVGAVIDSVLFEPGQHQTGIQGQGFALSFGLRTARSYLDASTCSGDTQSYYQAFGARDPD